MPCSWVQWCMRAISEDGKEIQRGLGTSGIPVVSVTTPVQPLASEKGDPWPKAIVHVQLRGRLGGNLLPVGNANLQEQSANADVCSLFNTVEVSSTFP